MAQKNASEAFKKAMNSMPKGPSSNDVGNGAKGVLALLGLGYAGTNAFFSVEGGHRAVMFNRFTGVNQDKVYGEGLNFNIPWFEYPTIFDVRTRPCNLQTLTGSKDLQMVTLGVRVLHKPDQNKLPFIYTRLGKDYDEKVLPSIMNEVAKAVVAKFNSSELLTKRDVVSLEIRKELSKRARTFDILLDDVAITHLSFATEYQRAVEAKQVAQQAAERAKYVVQGALSEKQTIITKAKGEAASAELIGDSVKKNPGFMQLRKIDAAKDIADTVSKSGNKIYLNSDSLLLNLLTESDVEKNKTLSSGWFGGLFGR